MASKLKKLFGRKAVTLGLIFSILLPVFYVPSLAPRSQAFLGVGDVTIDSISNILVPIFKGIGQLMAKKMLDDIVQSTIKWANSGFEGNPAFLSQPSGYFGSLIEGSVGDYIRTATTSIISVNGKPKVIELGFLCSPFQARIKLSLIKQQAQPETRFQCTLDQIGANIDNFSKDFTQGGWDAWFAITSSESSDPYGAYIQANASLNSEISKTIDTKKGELAANGGFLNFKVCPASKKNVYPPPSVVANYKISNSLNQSVIRGLYPNWDPLRLEGECLLKDEDIPVKTPGLLIKDSISKSALSGIDKLISADSINAIASAFLSGILQRYVFSKKGLADDSSNAAAQEEVIDVDGDRLPDGYDTNGDGQLDICHHGIKDPSKSPSNSNCIGSKNATNSPFFIQICKATDEAITAVDKYSQFVIANPTWDPYAAKNWEIKAMNTAEAIDNFISTLSRYETTVFNKAIGDMGVYSNGLNNMVSSLVKDHDLPGRSEANNNPFIQGQLADAPKRLAYLRQFKATITQCDNPNLNALGNVTGSGGGGVGETFTPTLSCSPSNSNPLINTPVTWFAYSTYPLASTTAFRWSGDEISSVSSQSIEDLNVSYSSNGVKSTSLTATLSNGSQVVAECSPGVTVVPPGEQQ